MIKNSILIGDMIVFYILIYYSVCIEGRVYCQDSNAKPWIPLGFTCPVVCASVITAIERLIMSDYKRSIKEQLGGDPRSKSILIGDDLEYIDNAIPIYNSEQDKNKIARKNGVETNDENGNNKDVRENYENRNNKDGEANYENRNNKDVEANYENRNNNDREEKYENRNNKDGEANFENRKKEKKRDGEVAKYENKHKTAHSKDIDVKTKIESIPIDVNNLDIIANIKYAKGILRRNGKFANNTKGYMSDNNIQDGKCWFMVKFKAKLLLGKVIRRKCSRRSNFDGKFVSVMTNVLNKYVETIFRFTDEMTEILLENIFGKNTDLRNNIFDVNKLLNYLRKSVDRHKIHTRKQVITLKSRHCLTVSMPGCFCRSGYVESSGQCVKPEDCVTNEEYFQYLARIVVL